MNTRRFGVWWTYTRTTPWQSNRRSWYCQTLRSITHMETTEVATWVQHYPPRSTTSSPVKMEIKLLTECYFFLNTRAYRTKTPWGTRPPSTGGVTCLMTTLDALRFSAKFRRKLVVWPRRRETMGSSVSKCATLQSWRQEINPRSLRLETNPPMALSENQRKNHRTMRTS